MQAEDVGLLSVIISLFVLIIARRMVSSAKRVRRAMTMDPKAKDWFANEYYSSLTEKLNASLDYLHNAITWSITMTTAGVGVILTQQGFPDKKSWFLSWSLIIFVTHFCVRAAKGYINVIRYAALQRRILDCYLLEAVGDKYVSM